MRALGARHRDRRLPPRPGRDPLRCSRSCSTATPALQLPERRRPPPRASSTSTATRVDVGRDGGPPRRSPSTASSARSPPRSTPRACARSTTRSRCPLVAGARPHGGRRRRRRRRRAAPPQRPRSSAECERAARARSWSDAGERVQRELHPAAARDPLRRARPHARRRRRRPATPPTPPVAREAARPAPDHRAPARATARSRSCAPPTARACSPRSAPDGRIHATFNQTVARTGRLSLRPARTCTTSRCAPRWAGQFRKAFVPAAGLRAPGRRLQPDRAALHRPPGRGPGPHRRRSSRGQDIHTATASRVFGVEPGDVTIEQRSKAKMVSYGLAYGMEAYGLGQRLNIPTEEAPEILDAYFVAFPAVQAYMERTVAEARERGYTETLFGRRRQIPELSSSNFRIRQAGERQAMNAGIQGLAADIFKVALVRLDAGARRGGGSAAGSSCRSTTRSSSRCPPDEHDDAAALVRRRHGRARSTLRVPLEVNLSSAPAGPTPSGADAASEREWSDREHFADRDRWPRDGRPGGVRPPEWACSAGSGDRRPLVRAGRRPPRRGLPAVLVHQGHRAGGRRSSSTRSASSRATRVLDVGCGPGRHAHALARRGHRGRRRRHQPAVRRPRHAPTPRPAPPSSAADARALPFDARVRRRDLALPGRLRPAPAARAPAGSTASTRRAVLDGHGPGAAARRARSPCRPSPPTSRCATWRTHDTFDADAGVNHERTVVRDEDGRATPTLDLWTTCFTPRELRLLAGAAPGSRSRDLWSVTPGRLRRRRRPTIEHAGVPAGRPPRRP